MDHLILRSLSPKNLKSEARKCFPRVQSSYLTEAIARGLGFGTQAALLSSVREGHYHRLAHPFELKRFGRALIDFGFDPAAEFEHRSWSWQSAVLWEVLLDFVLQRNTEIERDGRIVLSASTCEVVSSLSKVAGALVPEDRDEPELASDWLKDEMSALTRLTIEGYSSGQYQRQYVPVTNASIFNDTDMLSVEFDAVVAERMALHQTLDMS